MAAIPTRSKSTIRQQVWPKLRRVAYPDSRFHYDFSSFIADFQGSDIAIDSLTSLPCYASAKTIFITPDNCLEKLRYKALQDRKTVLITTYAIRRGFWLLKPAIINTPEKRRMASLLDGMEKPGLGCQIGLAEMRETAIEVDLMVTGTGAINLRGLRFGKGHGFFDLEWAMLSSIGVVNAAVPCVAVGHDCQVLDQELEAEVFDTVCDWIVTPTRVIEVQRVVEKPSCGVVWDRLQEGMLEDIPPLQELKTLTV